jgi:alanyl-tRNA synthetase
VTPERFRFDFAYGKSLKREEISRIEDMVNARIRENHPVKTEAMAYKDALAKGVIALFGEKYGDIVRAVSIGDFSTELCGGTHTGATGQIGLFTILSDTAIGAGVRRIEALTGSGAIEHFKTTMNVLEEASGLLGSGREDLLDRMGKLLDEKKALKKEIEKLSRKISGQKPVDVMSSMREIKGIKVLSAEVDDVDLKTLRDMAEATMERLGSGIVVLGTIREEKAHLVAFVSKELTGRYHAGKLLTAAAEIVGGRGGAGGLRPGRRDKEGRAEGGPQQDL